MTQISIDPVRQAEVQAAFTKRKLELKGLVPNPSKWWYYTPYPKQQVLLDGDYPEVFYGGAAGGAKSVLLLMAASKYVDYGNYKALIIRQTTNALKEPSGIIELSKRFFGGTSARYNERDMKWTFPSGATITFGFLDEDRDLNRYQGGGYSFIGFDELPQLKQHHYTGMFARVRKSSEATEIPLRVYSTGNPDPKAMWVYDYFIKDAVQQGDFCFFKEHEGSTGKKYSSLFVPAYLDDNPGLDKESYLASLGRLDPVTLRRMLKGDWLVKPEGDIYKFREAWHIITWSAFTRIVGTPTIPRHWSWGMGFDWGSTQESLSGAVWTTRAAANLADKNPLLKNAKFIFREANWFSPIPDEVHDDIVRFELEDKLVRKPEFRIMSHDKLTERNIFERQYKMPFIQAVHPVDAGITVIQNELAIRDYHLPHPFNEGVMGRPNLYFIVPDDQGRPYENPDKSDKLRPILVTPARNAAGLAGLREDLPCYRWEADGKPMHDTRGLLDALRMIGWRMFPAEAGKTKTEREDEVLPYELRMANIQEQQDFQQANQIWHNRQLQLGFNKMIKEAVDRENKARKQGQRRVWENKLFR